MARSVDLSQFDFVLESDRTKPELERTIFTLISRTVDQVNTDAAANLNRLFLKGRKDESVERIGLQLTERQATSFQEVVLKVTNFKVAQNAPRGFWDKHKDEFKQVDDGLVVTTDNPKIIRELFFLLHSDDSAEILQEVDNKSHASTVEKN